MLIVIWPTLRVYSWTGHELTAPYIRTLLMSELWLAEGRIHTPWLPQPVFGYGWPFFTFYAPLGYYVGALPHALGWADAAQATNFSFYFSLWVGGCGLLLLARLWLGPGGVAARVRRPWLWGLAAASVFTFAPYHHADIFARGALAESWGFAIFPWVIAALEMARRRPWQMGVPAVAVAYGGLMLSHNLTALYGSLFIAAWVALTNRYGRGTWWRWPLACMMGGGLGLMLSAYFWFPAMRLTPLVLASDVNEFWGTAEKVREHALAPVQFFIQQWGKQWSRAGVGDGFAVNPGYITMAVLLLGVLSAIWRMKSPGRQEQVLRRRLIVSLLLAGAALWMTTQYYPWGAMPPLLRYIQFPWRLLLFAITFASIALVLAAGRWGCGGGLRDGLALPCIVLPVIFAAPQTANTTKLIQNRMTDRELWDEYAIKIELGRAEYVGSLAREYLPLGADRKYTVPVYVDENPPPPSRLEVPEAAAAGFELFSSQRIGTTYFWYYRAAREVRATLHVFWFPGWELTVGEDEVAQRGDVGRSATGLVEVTLPAGEHVAQLGYGLSPAGWTGMRVTRAGWVVWGAWLLVGTVRARKKGRALGKAEMD